MRAHLRTFTGEEYSVGDEKLPIECFRCGICCQGYYPQLDDEEIERISRNLGISSKKFISDYVQITTIGCLLRQTKSGCVFLNWEEGGKALCSIHSFRPDACRAWEPSLFRRECREGLAKIQKSSGLMLVDEVFENAEQREKFCASLRQENVSHSVEKRNPEK